MFNRKHVLVKQLSTDSSYWPFMLDVLKQSISKQPILPT